MTFVVGRFMKVNEPDRFLNATNEYLDEKKRNDVLVLQSILSSDRIMTLKVHNDIENLDKENKELSKDWHSKYAEKSGGAEMLDGFISSVIGSNDPDGKLDGQLNYYHVISGKTKDDGDIKAAAMFKESLKTNGSKLLEEGIRWFGLNPITGIPINRFIMFRGFKNSKVVDKYLVPWSDPAEPTHSTYTRIWQDQFASDWSAGLFRTIRQIIH
tara:strand:+ start:61 stop:699 length:639 start_codon:yes stop_codon:yes gene_type:complete